jgi:hypothetical protein
MSDQPRIEIRKVPVIETGVGASMGYVTDAAFITASAEARELALAMLTPDARARFERAEAEQDRRLLGS